MTYFTFHCLAVNGNADPEITDRWEEASIVTAMCLRTGRQGVVGGLGMPVAPACDTSMG